MKSYRITYTEIDLTAKTRGEAFKTIEVAPAVEAKNGIDAIKSILRAKLTDAELVAELDTIWTGGSNKRIHFHGITFEANLVRSSS